jgi:hypothetical protein
LTVLSFPLSLSLLRTRVCFCLYFEGSARPAFRSLFLDRFARDREGEMKDIFFFGLQIRGNELQNLNNTKKKKKKKRI